MSMSRTDFDAGITSLANAYRESTDELAHTDPAANQLVLNVLQLWWELLSVDLQFVDGYEQTVLPDAKSVREHEEAVQQLDSSIRRFDSKNIEIVSLYLLGTLKNYAKKVEKLVIDRAGRVRGAEGHTAPEFQTAQNERRTITLLLARVEQAELSHQLRQATQRAMTAVEAAEKAAEDARKAAGVASRSKLTERFEALAQRHFKAATLFRILTAVGVLGGIIWGSIHADAMSGTETDTTAEAILRVSLLAGILGLATYFGRQAAYHRDVSTWASTIKEQLLTFDGYIDPVDDAQLRDQMRAAFAARVFGSSPESKDEPGVTLSSPVLSEVAAMFTKTGSGK